MQCIEDLNLIFIHIPKTGGSFIERNLKNIKFKIFNKKTIFGGHQNYKWFNKNIVNINTYDIFTIVRNPYNRIISAFYYLIKPERIEGDKKEIEYLGNPLNLSTFIDNIYNEYKINKINRYIHITLQYKFLINDENKIASNISIFKYETLDKDFFNFISKYKNNNKVYNLFIKDIYNNIKIKEDYEIHNILSKDDISKINEIYDEDFKLFNYDKIII